MLTPENFGRCVAIKIGVEKRAVTPYQDVDLSGNIGSFVAPPDTPQPRSSSSIGPTPERTWRQYAAELLHGYDRKGLNAGFGGVAASDLYRENQRRQAPQIADMQRGYPGGDIPAPRTLLQSIYDRGAAPWGTRAFAEKNNLTHLSLPEQAKAYQAHLDAQNQEMRSKGQALDQRIDKALEDHVLRPTRNAVGDLGSFATDPETRTRTMAALGDGAILPAWWPSWAGGQGAEAQRKQIEAAQKINPSDVRFQTELLNETPIAKGVLEARRQAGIGAQRVQNELGRIGDDLATPGTTLMGALGRSGQRINESLPVLPDPVALGRATRTQLGWDKTPQSASAKTPAKPPAAPSFWDSITQTATDTGKKLQGLMTDRRYAPLIALPALGLGAYGLYDLLRDKKRRKRPKFYDENAREF